MLSSPLFRDRQAAGEELARVILLQLSLEHPNFDQIIVYALPRGGLPVAAPIAERLQCPLTVAVAKKITLPENPELALGAVTSDGHVLWSKRKPQDSKLQHNTLQEAQEKARRQWERFSPSCPQVNPKGSLALLVDDGIATGMTMAVAAQALRTQEPKAIWICVPVAPFDLIPTIQEWCDRMIILQTPHPFLSVSRFYEQFDQVDTETAISHLQGQGDGGTRGRGDGGTLRNY